MDRSLLMMNRTSCALLCAALVAGGAACILDESALSDTLPTTDADSRGATMTTTSGVSATSTTAMSGAPTTTGQPTSGQPTTGQPTTGQATELSASVTDTGEGTTSEGGTTTGGSTSTTTGESSTTGGWMTTTGGGTTTTTGGMTTDSTTEPAFCGDGEVQEPEYCDDDHDDDGVSCEDCFMKTPPGAVGCDLAWPQSTDITATSSLGELHSTRAFFGAFGLDAPPSLYGSQIFLLGDGTDADEFFSDDDYNTEVGTSLTLWFGEQLPEGGKWVVDPLELVAKHYVSMKGADVETTVVIESIAGSWLFPDPKDPPRLIGHLEGAASGPLEAVYCQAAGLYVHPE